MSRVLETPTKIGPFFWPEIMAITLLELVLFFALLILRSCFLMSRWWLLAGPALFLIVFILAKAFRGQEQPMLMLSYYSWHVMQHKKIHLKELTMSKHALAGMISLVAALSPHT